MECGERVIVLDTQSWIWWLHDPVRLSRRARTAVEQAEKSDGLRVSVISVWEIAVKTQLGKLVLPLEIDEWFQRASAYPNIVIEPLTAGDAIASTRLPGAFHKDPADRIIVALARRYGVPLITSDANIRAYRQVRTIW
jgi:PIN domain nuclease of toxin-antitoxin system